MMRDNMMRWNNKVQADKLAKNTIALYIRQFFVLIISFYTTSMILSALGADDYGLYNVIAGFVSMFGIISIAFSTSISRFLSYALGENDIQKIQSCFSTSIITMIIISVLIIIIIIGVGAWYIPNKMVFKEDRTSVAFFVLIMSSIGLLINMISVPYNALIIANEKMRAFAFIGMLETSLKLVVACLLRVIEKDGLVLYSIFTVLVSLIIRMTYIIYCNRMLHTRFSRDYFMRSMIGKMFRFIGWTFLGIGSDTIKGQGVNMILNLFGGTVVNAARGLSLSVYSGIMGFMNNFIQALQPQVIKAYSAQNDIYMHNILHVGCRVSFFLTSIFVIPVIKNINYLLVLWLKDVPEYTSSFVIIMLVGALFTSMSMPLLYGIYAVGNLKYYEMSITIINLLTVVIMYFLLRAGLSINFAYTCNIVTSFLNSVTIVFFSIRLYKFNLLQYVFNDVSRMLFVLTLQAFFGSGSKELFCVNQKNTRSIFRLKNSRLMNNPTTPL